MAFCPNCGTAVEGRFCPKCGTAMGATPDPGAPPQPPPGPTPGYIPPPPPIAAGAGLEENVASALCYVLGLVTGILFLVMAPYSKNRTIRFHAFQSIFFHVAWIVILIALSIIRMTLPFGLHLLSYLLSMVLWFGGFLLWLFLMWKAYNRQRFVLPIVGPLAEQQANSGV